MYLPDMTGNNRRIRAFHLGIRRSAARHSTGRSGAIQLSKSKLILADNRRHKYVIRTAKRNIPPLEYPYQLAFDSILHDHSLCLERRHYRKFACPAFNPGHPRISRARSPPRGSPHRSSITHSPSRRVSYTETRPIQTANGIMTRTRMTRPRPQKSTAGGSEAAW